MQMFTLLALGLGAVIVAAGAVWFFVRSSSSETDLGSISRNWVVEHRNDVE